MTLNGDFWAVRACPTTGGWRSLGHEENQTPGTNQTPGSSQVPGISTLSPRIRHLPRRCVAIAVGLSFTDGNPGFYLLTFGVSPVDSSISFA